MMPEMNSGKPDTVNKAQEAPQQSDHELLEQILQEQKRTAAAQKAAAAAGWCIAAILFFCAVFLLPKASAVMRDVQDTALAAQNTLNNIDAIMKDVDTLVADNSGNLTNAVTKISEIDFDRLNDSIKALSDVVSPLAKLFGH